MQYDDWFTAVGAYVDELEGTAAEMASVLDALQSAVRSGTPEEVQGRSAPLETLNERLAVAADERQQLLAACPLAGDAPRRSLIAALRHVGDVEAAQLALRCEQVGGRIAGLGESATAMFIANYHLMQTTGDMVRLITTGAAKSPTYDRPPRTGGGSVLDRAA